jgi:hypothetical protein
VQKRFGVSTGTADELNVPTALPPGGKEIPTPVEQEVGWAPETVRALQGREK